MNTTAARILLVEDSPSDAELLQEMLHQACPGRFEVTCVDRLAEAVTRLRSETFDVLLLDLLLPDSAGPETYHRAREAAPQLPIVLLTGLGDDAIGVEAIRSGVQDYLIKGEINGRQIARTLGYAIERQRLEEAVRLSKERERQRAMELETVLQSVPAAVWIAHDPDCRHITGNFVADQLLRLPAGSEASLTAPEELRPTHFKFLKNGRELTGDAMPVQRAARGYGVCDFEFRLAFTDGSAHDLLGHAAPLRDEHGLPRGAVAAFVDVTERKAAEDELRRLSRILRALSKSNHALMRATKEAEFVEEVCRLVIEDCGYAMAWVGHAEEDEGKTIRPVAHAGFKAGSLETLKFTWADNEQGRGPTGTAIRTGQPVICRNMLIDPAFAPWRDHAAKLGYASAIVLPLKSDGGTFGALNIYSTATDPFSDEEVKLLAELADDLAYGIATIRLRFAREWGEEELRQSEERYRGLVELSPDAVLVDLNGSYAFANEAAIHLFGAGTFHELLRRDVLDLVHPEDQPIVADDLSSLEEEAHRVSPRREFRIMRLDGRPVAVEGQAASVMFHGRRAIQLVLHDITERKQAGEQMRLLATALQSAANGIVVTRVDGTIQWVNAAFTRLTGYTAAEAIGKTPRVLRSGRHPPEFYANMWRTALSGRVWHGEVINKRKDGSLYTEEMTITPVEGADGVITHFIAIKQDVTVRKGYEGRLEFQARMLDSVGQAVLATDLSQTLIYWNQTAATMFGWSREEALGRKLPELLPPQTCPIQITEIMAAIQRGEGWSGELVLPRRDGSLFPVHTTNSPLMDEAGQCVAIIGVGVDLTERKRNEEQLRESEERYRNLVEMSPDAILLEIDGCCVFANPAAIKLANATSREQLLGQDLLSFVHSDDHAKVSALLRQLRGSSVTSLPPVEFRTLRLDGTPVDVEGVASLAALHGRPAVQIILRDITGRKRAEKAIRESQERLTLAQQAGHVGVFDLDLKTRTAIWSAERKSIFGVSDGFRETIEAWGTFVHPEDRAMAEADLKRAIEARRRKIEQEYRIRRPDGETRWLEDRGFISYDHAGTPLRIVGTTIDITREKEAHEKLRQQGSQFRQSAVRLVTTLALAVFLAEIFVMGVLAVLPPLPTWVTAVMDALSAIILISPVLYFFAYRPLVRLLREREQGEEDLHRANQHLESRVKDRTASLELANEALQSEIRRRETVEQALRESRADLNRAQTVAHTGSWRMDSNRHEMTWSEEIHRIFGIAKEVPLSHDALLETVHPQDRAFMNEAWHAALKGQPYDIDYRIVVQDEVRWIHSHAELDFNPQGDVRGCLGIIQDITARKHDELALAEALRQQEVALARLDAVFECAPLGLGFCDSDLRFVRVNGALAATSGVSAENHLGRTPEDVAKEARHGGGLMQHWRIALESSEPRVDLDVMTEAPGTAGEPCWFAATWFPVKVRGHSIGLGATFLDITERRQATEALKRAHDLLEDKVRERTAELVTTNKALKREIAGRRSLEAQILEISEAEQKRIGQDLHDGLCQELAGIAYLCNATQRELDAVAPEQAHTVGELSRLIMEANSHANGIARGLFPVNLESGGLMAALRMLTIKTEAVYRIPTDFECPQPVLVQDNTIATHLFRIAQEALSNASRHAAATRLILRFIESKDGIVLSIIDNGTGFVPGGRPKGGGLGLETMRFRAQSIGANLTVQPGTDSGTIVTCELPEQSPKCNQAKP